MVKLSETSHAINWLSQFNSQEQTLASELLDAITLVSRDTFADQLCDLIRNVSQTIDGPVGLYVEREVKKWKRMPNRLFKESKGKVKRAQGNGPKIITPKQGYDQEVGSEGTISQLVTELQRKDRKKFFLNPGPKQIRDNKIRAFVLVTDFIGSGKRADDYLTSAWRVASVKSWTSRNHLSFHVVAFSGTQRGINKIRSHKSKPQIHEVLSCPTIDSAFDYQKAVDIKDLCKKHDPDNKHDDEALGYGGTGGLIAFSHGAPNNLPKILHRKSRKWRPLFTGRSTADVRAIFGEQPDNDDLAARLNRLKQHGITKSGWLTRKTTDARSLILLMATLKSAPRFDDVLSRKTGLTIPEIGSFIDQLKEWNWIDANRRLTDEGYKQLRHARKQRRPQKELPQPTETLYYPKSLRMPL
ncbi:MAG: hypothetical protein ACE5EM_05945 [Sphingomonadales bacterium]